MVTVIVISFPTSEFLGEYLNENGEAFDETGVTEPAPSSVILTLVALPPKVFPSTVIVVVPHVVPLMLLRVTVGLFEHCPDKFIEINKKTETKK